MVTFRYYAWTDEQVDKYKKMKDKEMFDLFGDVSSSVQAAMESLGQELYHYLEEAEGKASAGKERRSREKARKNFYREILGRFLYAAGSKRIQKRT